MPDKPGIAVIEFASSSEEMWWWSKGVSAVQDVFTFELTKSRRFRVVDREQLMSVAQDLKLSGDVSPRTAMKAGKLLGVDYLVTGALLAYGKEISESGLFAEMRAQAIETASGETVWSDQASVSKPKERFRADDPKMFDLLLKPVVQQLTASLKSAGIVV